MTHPCAPSICGWTTPGSHGHTLALPCAADFISASGVAGDTVNSTRSHEDYRRGFWCSKATRKTQASSSFPFQLETPAHLLAVPLKTMAQGLDSRRWFPSSTNAATPLDSRVCGRILSLTWPSYARKIPLNALNFVDSARLSQRPTSFSFCDARSHFGSDPAVHRAILTPIHIGLKRNTPPAL